MKQISRKQISETVKKEYTEGLNWENQRYGNYFSLMIDVDDAAIWSAVYGENDWGVYHSSSIHCLEKEGTCDEIVMVYCISQAIKLLQAAGWTITD